ncbi:MAG: cupin-like domain-containing protein [Nostoc sp. DedVER02]|uniref:cupin-like domain-containing protein n=1 Tax=unclassified Nostoc TaxID=2593658 RepID=UPI002AD4614F|nr:MULTISPECIES: cupin-like domain-containing protein [unclassified Nostoc]MDZ7985859.1 cupin-like domain-containing protein [Nostoc sp. DedVER02]MDZ8114694.1 cupin-like domain-containing protein [Nostoc sp. DedVER01b]
MQVQATKSILRIHNPSTTKFLEMWKQYQPFLIEGVVDKWDACKKWSNDYLKKQCGDNLVHVQFYKKDFLNDYKQFAYEVGYAPLKEMKYKEYIENNNDDLGCYLYEADFEKYFPEITEDVTYPEYFSSKPYIYLWHGFSSKSFTSPSTLHFDRIHNLFVQVRGRKRFLLFPPSNYLSFYPPLEDSSGIGHNSKVNPDLLNLELFPKFPWQERIEVVLQPGEMLYLPPFWWHHVTAIDENISLSFWYDVKIQDFFQQKKMLSVFFNIAPHYLSHAMSSGDIMHTMNFFKGIIK